MKFLQEVLAAVGGDFISVKQIQCITSKTGLLLYPVFYCVEQSGELNKPRESILWTGMGETNELTLKKDNVQQYFIHKSGAILQ
jgi:hypothetical protein